MDFWRYFNPLHLVGVNIHKHRGERRDNDKEAGGGRDRGEEKEEEIGGIDRDVDPGRAGGEEEFGSLDRERADKEDKEEENAAEIDELKGQVKKLEASVSEMQIFIHQMQQAFSHLPVAKDSATQGNVPSPSA